MVEKMPSPKMPPLPEVPFKLQSFSAAKTAVTASQRVDFKVTLSSAATVDAKISLKAKPEILDANKQSTLKANVIVKKGATSADFSVLIPGTVKASVCTITASFGSVSKEVKLTISAAK